MRSHINREQLDDVQTRSSSNVQLILVTNIADNKVKFYFESKTAPSEVNRALPAVASSFPFAQINPIHRNKSMQDL
ncbi:MAG TPA: hypothetical protein DDW76_02650 [Cyanobacteria bacterium UBA11369]|nr:hypothetical protein [Cyanobacteria bacterium UBA11371]HBE34893.1 hypothetical protein [Cyanobacteria bacterium UBA11368]HBE47729.1 hypothetical protein [Cyanobacteria bacterium UBA11369]